MPVPLALLLVLVLGWLAGLGFAVITGVNPYIVQSVAMGAGVLWLTWRVARHGMTPQERERELDAHQERSEKNKQHHRDQLTRLSARRAR